MRVRLLRGTQEIGGNCVEVEAADSGIVLDVGRPLDALRDDVISLLEIALLALHLCPNVTISRLQRSASLPTEWGTVAQCVEPRRADHRWIPLAL